MDCRALCDHIMDYMEGRLTPEEAEAFAAHLSACSACRKLWAEEQAMAALLGGETGDSLVENGFVEKVMAGLPARPGEATREVPVPVLPGRRVAAAAVFLAAVTLGALLLRGPALPASTPAAAVLSRASAAVEELRPLLREGARTAEASAAALYGRVHAANAAVASVNRIVPFAALIAGAAGCVLLVGVYGRRLQKELTGA